MICGICNKNEAQEFCDDCKKFVCNECAIDCIHNKGHSCRLIL